MNRNEIAGIFERTPLPSSPSWILWSPWPLGDLDREILLKLPFILNPDDVSDHLVSSPVAVSPSQWSVVSCLTWTTLGQKLHKGVSRNDQG